MCLFKRNTKLLKGYVHNHYQLEDCTIECCIVEDALEFYTEYVSNRDFLGLPPNCMVNYTIKKPLGGVEVKMINALLLDHAHLCILENILKLQSYIQ